MSNVPTQRVSEFIDKYENGKQEHYFVIFMGTN